MEINIKFNNFEELADWIHKSEKHREELEQDNYELQKENMQLRSELEQIKNATAANSDDVVIPKAKPFNTDSIPRELRKRKE